MHSTADLQYPNLYAGQTVVIDSLLTDSLITLMHGDGGRYALLSVG